MSVGQTFARLKIKKIPMNLVIPLEKVYKPKSVVPEQKKTFRITGRSQPVRKAWSPIKNL